MRLLLDPITSRHRRCLSLDDAPHIYKDEKYRLTLEGINLDLKNDSRNKSKIRDCLGMDHNKTYGHETGTHQHSRRFLPTIKTGRRVGIEPKASDEEGCTQDAVFRSNGKSTIALRLSSSNRKHLEEDQVSYSRPEVQVEEDAVHLQHEGFFKDCTINKKVSLVQAVVRGYLGRSTARQLRLQRKLIDIQLEKQKDLDWIEAKKKQEVQRLRSKFAKHSRSGPEINSKTGLITQLIKKVQQGRDKNSKMEQQLQCLRDENKRLAMANTECLKACKQKELQLNRADWCSLRLIELVKMYRDTMRVGRKMLTDLDGKSEADLSPMTQGELDRVSEIKRMLKQAKTEDLLLVQSPK